jgi:hypothetical protein
MGLSEYKGICLYFYKSSVYKPARKRRVRRQICTTKSNTDLNISDRMLRVWIGCYWLSVVSNGAVL